MPEFEGVSWTRDGVSVSIGLVPRRKGVALYTGTGAVSRVHGYFSSEEEAAEAIRMLDFVITGEGEVPQRQVPDSGARKLTPAEARAARKLRATGAYSIRDLAAMYHVARSTMSYVIHGLTYQDAGGPVEDAGTVKYTKSVIAVS